MQEIIYLGSRFYLPCHRFPRAPRLGTASLGLRESQLSIKSPKPTLTGTLGSRPSAPPSLPLFRFKLCQEFDPSANRIDGDQEGSDHHPPLAEAVTQVTDCPACAQHVPSGSILIPGQDLEPFLPPRTSLVLISDLCFGDKLEISLRVLRRGTAVTEGSRRLSLGLACMCAGIKMSLLWLTYLP